MADSQKGASTADSKKKSPSVEDDFGKDFLSSWKPAKMGKDTLDFNVEAAPRNKKKAFDFDKLDDFELGGDFDKLSSFKMDMPDLDFSSPLKKTKKPKDKSSDKLAPGKQESKREEFSFNFDFNELDSFGLDSNLLKGESKAGKCAGHNSPNHSFKNDTDQDSRSNSVTSTDVFQVQETKKVPNANMVTSKPDNLVEAAIVNGANSPTPSYQNPRHHGSDVQLSMDNQITLAEENETETHNSEGCRERTDRTYPEKATADLTSQSVSGNDSAKEALPRLPTGFTSSDAVKADSAREEDRSMRSIDSSQSRNNSPVNSCNSKCSPETSITASSNNSGEFEKHRKNKIEGIGGSAVSSEPTQGQKNVGNASATNFLRKVSQTVKNTGDIQNSSSKLLQSPLLKGSGTVRSIPMKQKPNNLMQFNTFNKSSENASEPTSSPALKQFDSVHNWKLKSASIYPVSENRESKQADEQAENRKDGVLKSFEKCSIKDAPVITARKRIDLAGDISSSPLKTSNLLQQSTASSTAKSVIPNLVSGAARTKGSKIITFEMKSPCLKDDRKIPPITKLSSNAPKSTSHQEAKSVRFSERNLELLNSVSKKADSILTEKCALLRSPLKRKSTEVSTADPEFSNPLKRVMETSNGRNSFVVSRTSEKKMVPGTQTPEACHNDACAENLTSNGSPVLGRLINVELPMLIEKDGNVEKAEACAKDLDDICNMLKKKQEEAKELLVRAIVNNNALLMLNHPLFDEKVRTLQRFATGLQSKEF